MRGWETQELKLLLLLFEILTTVIVFWKTKIVFLFKCSEYLPSSVFLPWNQNVPLNKV